MEILFEVKFRLLSCKFLDYIIKEIFFLPISYKHYVIYQYIFESLQITLNVNSSSSLFIIYKITSKLYCCTKQKVESGSINILANNINPAL